MFQHKIDEIFKNLPNVFDIADDILVVGYDTDGKDHEEMLWQVIQVCRQVNLKLKKKDKCFFRCTSLPFFGEVMSRYGVQPDPQKLKALTDMPPPKTKKEFQTFLSTINYLGKFSPSMAEVCESLRKLTSAKTKWIWNATYQKMLDNAKASIKEDACLKFYDETKPLYIETDASGFGLGAALLQTRSNTNCHRDEALDNSILQPIAFTCNSLIGAEKNTAILKQEH